jgi:hypothetical protein
VHCWSFFTYKEEEQRGRGGGVNSESYKREAQFQTRWDQHAVVQCRL